MPEIRPKIRVKHVQRAQGMVEFALVLPLLLLLILGVFAFGHLFFVYTSVVSASREAARWGSAVGEAPSSFPRYEDCNSIRDQAVRLGAFAGVNDTDIADTNDTGVAISYDHGPNADGSSSPYTTCPVGGPGPTDVQMGDRIIVRVKVNYAPIVPVVNLPSFPLEATTYRTILKSVPVGEAPTAVDPCITDTTITIGPPTSRVGEPVSYTGSVAVKDTKKYNGPVVGELYVTGDPADSSDGKWDGCVAAVTDGTFTCQNAVTYPTVGDKNLRAIFRVTDQSNACLQDSLEPLDFVHTVIAADTTIQLSVQIPPQPQVNQSMTANVVVQAVMPGSGIPTGRVLLTWEDPNNRQTQSVTLDASGSGSWIFAPRNPGVYELRAEYPDPGDKKPDLNFNSSTASIYVSVIQATPTPGGTSTPGPSPTPPPPYCPTAGGMAFNNNNNTITVNVSNGQSAAEPVQLTAVILTWNRIPSSPITGITFGGGLLWPAPNTNNLPVLAPPQQVIDKNTKGWAGPSATLAVNSSGQLVITFGGALPSGSTNKYTLGLTFTSTLKKGFTNCVLTIDGYNY